MKFRQITMAIETDLRKKMVFLAGPRQVGKTYLSKKILKNFKCGVYLNWDNRRNRKTILAIQ